MRVSFLQVQYDVEGAQAVRRRCAAMVSTGAGSRRRDGQWVVRRKCMRGQKQDGQMRLIQNFVSTTR